jgi:O-antigen/teichoic acid export membrane protein
MPHDLEDIEGGPGPLPDVATAAPAADRVDRPEERPAVVRSGLMSMVALAALGSARLIHGSLVSRTTSHDTYAVVGTLISIAMAAGLFLPGGLSSAASKFIPYQRARGSSAGAFAVYHGLRRVAYAWSVVAGLVGGFAAGVLLDLSVGEAVAGGLLIAAFSLYSLEKSALYGFDRVPAYVRLELIGSGTAVLATVVVVGLHRNLYLWPLIIGYSILVIGASALLRRRSVGPRVAIPRELRREMIGYVGLASVGGLSAFGFLQSLPVLAGHFTSRAEVAQFVAAVTLVGPLYFVPRALALALFPALAHAHGAGDLERVRQHTDVSTRALLVILAPLFAVAIMIAREVLVIFGGGSYADGQTVLQLLLIATCVVVSQVPAINSLSSGDRRDVRIPVSSSVLGCLAGLIASVPLGHWLGGVGVSISYLIAMLFTQRVIITVWRRYQMPWGGPLARSSIVVFGAFAISQVINATAPAGPRALIDIGAAVVWLALSALLLRSDIKSVVGLAMGLRDSGQGDPDHPRRVEAGPPA